MEFNQGKSIRDDSANKKKIGRRSIKKAMEVARKTGIEGLGENEKGISDVYKEYYDEVSEGNGVFRFGGGNEGEAVSSKCIVNLEQVKEIGELVGVSWVLAEEEKKDQVHVREDNGVKGVETQHTQ